jgi:hypothetical protein
MSLPATDDGTLSLAKYLADYQRITLKDACGYSIHSGDGDIGIWVRVRGKWQHATEAEQRIRWIEYQKGKSACESIIRELFGLNRAEYERIRGSFERPGWQSWAGIYQAKGKRSPRFVIVLELPDKGVMSSGVAGGIGGAAGLALGVLGTVGTHMMLNKKSSVDQIPDESTSTTTVDDVSDSNESLSEKLTRELQSERVKSDQIKKRQDELRLKNKELSQELEKLQDAKSNIELLNKNLGILRNESDARLKIVEPGLDSLTKSIRTKLDQTFESDRKKYADEWTPIMNSLPRTTTPHTFLTTRQTTLEPNYKPRMLINQYQNEHDEDQWLQGVFFGTHMDKRWITLWFNGYLYQILRATKPQSDEVSREDARKRVQSVIGPLNSDNYEQVELARQALENFYQALTLEYYADMLKKAQFKI